MTVHRGSIVTTVAGFVALTLASGSARAATITNQVLVKFQGNLSGTTYALGPGEIDTTGTFQANGAPSVAGGVAQNLANGDGFFVDPSSINGGDLNSVNWVAEIVFSPSVPRDQQLLQATLIDIQGDFDLRYQNGADSVEISYWDGSTSNVVSAPQPAVSRFTHLAVTWDATSKMAELYVGGVSQGVTGGADFEVPDASNVSWGFFGRNGFDDRSINGPYAAVAFSTFTGEFDPATDFQIEVPEPSSVALIGVVGGMFIRRKSWRKVLVALFSTGHTT